MTALIAALALFVTTAQPPTEPVVVDLGDGITLTVVVSPGVEVSARVIHPPRRYARLHGPRIR